MKRIIFFLSFVLLLFTVTITAFASDKKDASGVAITVVIPQSEQKKEAPTPIPTPKPPVNYLYPVGVYESQENGRREIIKTYELGVGEKPGDISRESFTREGWLYELTDIVKKETATADSREQIETVEIGTDTKDTEAIMKLLAATMEYQSENGYIGILSLDISSIKVETAGSKNSSYTISATREYPHLSSNDTSLVPKTITDSGKTLTLASIDWKTQNSDAVDYDQIASSYTAVAKYTGTGYKTTITGYTTTAEYHGTVSKILTGKTAYTAYFIGIQIVTPTVNKPTETTNATSVDTASPITEPETTITTEPDKTEEPTADDMEETETVSTAETEQPATPDATTETEPDTKPFNPLPIIIIVLAVAGIGGGFAYLYLHKNKKESEPSHDENEETD